MMYSIYTLFSMPNLIFKFLIICTLVYLINVLRNLLFFWKNPACTPLFRPARLSIFEIFQPITIFIVAIFGKFQTAQPYFILHIYYFLGLFHPTHLFHPARLLDRLEYLYVSYFLCLNKEFLLSPGMRFFFSFLRIIFLLKLGDEWIILDNRSWA